MSGRIFERAALVVTLLIAMSANAGYPSRTSLDQENDERLATLRAVGVNPSVVMQGSENQSRHLTIAIKPASNPGQHVHH